MFFCMLLLSYIFASLVIIGENFDVDDDDDYLM